MTTAKQQARELAMVEEFEIGTEDRVFFGHQIEKLGEPLTEGSGWYWQCRGCPDAFGPFETRTQAEDNYAATNSDD